MWSEYLSYIMSTCPASCQVEKKYLPLKATYFSLFAGNVRRSDIILVMITIMYSLCQKKRTFNSDFLWPPWGRGQTIHMAHNQPCDFLSPSLRGATKKFGINCAFLFTKNVYSIQGVVYRQ